MKWVETLCGHNKWLLKYGEKITEWRTISVRRIGRPRLRWEGDVREDVGKIKIQKWSKVAMDREAAERIVKQTRNHREL